MSFLGRAATEVFRPIPGCLCECAPVGTCRTRFFASLRMTLPGLPPPNKKPMSFCDLSVFFFAPPPPVIEHISKRLLKADFRLPACFRVEAFDVRHIGRNIRW